MTYLYTGYATLTFTWINAIYSRKLILKQGIFIAIYSLNNLLVVRLHREFQEALKATSEVKKTFVKHEDDLFKRGDRLIRESVLTGVTVMRAHVEVDSTVLHTCLQAGIKLKERWNDACDVQLCGKYI